MIDIAYKKSKRNIVLMILSVLVVCAAVYILISPADSMTGAAICGLEEHVHTGACYALQSPAALTCNTPAHRHSNRCYVLEASPSAPPMIGSVYVSQPDTQEVPKVQLISLPQGDVMPFAEAIKLEYGKNINKITLSYASGENWIEVTEGSTGLPADAGYRIMLYYHDIPVDNLIAAGGQMLYTDLPEWFLPYGTGMMFDGDKQVGMLYATDAGILVVFDDSYLQERTGLSLNGDITASGTCDWHKVIESGETGTIPNTGITFTFEDSVAQKYAKVEIEKSDPELTENNGKYYLKYTITVTSLDEAAAIPEVFVKDIFADVSYIEGYVGIPGGLDEPEALYPITEADSLEMNGSDMVWNIGTLEAGEERTLTYYAKIADSYVDALRSNPITNRAYVYAGIDTPYQKDDDSSSFRPKTEVSLQKELLDSPISNTGSGYLNYKITVSTAEDNSYSLNGLTLKDWFPVSLKNYLSGEENKISVTITDVTDPENPVSSETDADYNDASFELPLDLAPGQILEITYTVKVTNIFLASNDIVELTNTASIGTGGRTLASKTNTETLSQNTWIRKMYGDMISKDDTINFGQEDRVYCYQDGMIVPEENHSSSFEIKEGSHKYQVVLNENGAWDMSSTTMQDAFSSEYLKYTGYVRIDLYERSETDRNTAKSDANLLSELDGLTPVQTVWLKADGEGSFSFQPKDLGISDDDGKYTYLLTYYAKPNNVGNIGEVSVSNDFSIWGDVGIGNGSPVQIPQLRVSVSNVIKGSVNYEAKKMSWYYEPDPVYQSDAVGLGDYSEATMKSDYSNGAIYWVIRLEGTIPEGSATGSGNSTALSGFYIADDRGTANFQFRRDAVLGVYVGPNSLDFNEYDSYASFISENTDIQKLRGNPGNDKYFSSYYNAAYPDGEAAEYKWYCNENNLQGMIFPNGYKLEDDQALYIIIRTSPTSSVTSGNTANVYQNKLSVASGGSPVEKNTAEYVHQLKGALYKESKGAYIYDKDTNTVENISNKASGDWYIQNEAVLPDSGIYAAWLLNVNWDGTMEGTADVSDFLPEGMELVYADINNVGGSIMSNVENHPKTEYIEELHSDPAWQELIQECDVNTSYGYNPTKVRETAITYYNPTTREIRWRISNLTRGNVYNQYVINLAIVCKVTDPNLFLSGQPQIYENHAAIRNGDELTGMEVADVTITLGLDKELDHEALKGLNATENGDSITGQVNRLPFKLEVNPFAEDLSDSDTLPALIDEFSQYLRFVEGSLEVTYTADGTKYTGFTYSVEKDENGRETLIIRNLPDNTALTIRYQARIDGEPNEPVTISNIAYWEGYPPPDDAQVKNKEFKYDLTGSSFTDGDLAVTIRKVDADSHSKHLSGAEFALYAVDSSGELTGAPLRYGTTDSSGIVTFVNTGLSETEVLLQYNTVYCIVEKKAPSGYQLDSVNQWHFVIVRGNVPALPDGKTVDLWYESPQYEVSIENSKTKLSVEKCFMDANGNAFEPTEGSYRFGLFDGRGALIETLTITYSKGGKIYELDGMRTEAPEFTKFDPTMVYYIYELDDGDNPIMHTQKHSINGITYKVTYDNGSNEVSIVNSKIKITNQEVSVELPAAGGIGVKPYCAVGGVLSILALLLFVGRSKLMSTRKNAEY